MRYLLIFCSLLIANCKEKNSQFEKMSTFNPGQNWLDNKGKHINAHGGGILLHGNTYFWYDEHKIEGEIGNKAQLGVHLYTSANLYKWKDEGIVLRVDKTKSNSDISKGCILERQKVLFN